MSLNSCEFSYGVFGYLALAVTSAISSLPAIEIVLMSLTLKSSTFRSTMRIRLLSKVRK